MTLFLFILALSLSALGLARYAGPERTAKTASDPPFTAAAPEKTRLGESARMPPILQRRRV